MNTPETALVAAVMDAVDRDPLLIRRLPRRVVDAIERIDAERARTTDPHRGRGNWTEAVTA